jgi:hypothetical protein
MKFLNSEMADLKLRLLEKNSQPGKRPAPSGLSSETTELDRTIVYQAVEDKICKRTDLVARRGLTDRQAIHALRLLIEIVRRSGLSIDFSAAEIALLRGTSARMRTEAKPAAPAREQAL